MPHSLDTRISVLLLETQDTGRSYLKADWMARASMGGARSIGLKGWAKGGVPRDLSYLRYLALENTTNAKRTS